jgi:uncharacterized phage protein (predicted DNA packaging)
MACEVTLQDVKDHLRISSNAEDSILNLYLSAAREYVCKYLNRTDLPGLDVSPTEPVPYSIKAAMLLLVGDMYINREAQVSTPLSENKTLVNLLYPYRDDIGII